MNRQCLHQRGTNDVLMVEVEEETEKSCQKEHNCKHLISKSFLCDMKEVVRQLVGLPIWAVAVDNPFWIGNE